jgi:AraC family transcriptional regulator
MSGVALLSPTSAVVEKRKAAWDGIRVEYCQLRSGELPSHSHFEHVVLLSLSDTCRGEFITATGLGMSGKQVKGAVAVLPSGLAHQAVLDGPSEHLALYIDPALVHKAAADAQLKGHFEVQERYARSDKVISSIGMAFLEELDSSALSGRLYAESLANLLAVHLLRHYSNSNRVAIPIFNGGLTAAKLRQVTDYIAENYSVEIKLAELAQVAGMSSFHFAREFKKTTGTTPHQYLIKFRVDRAKSLLTHEELPLIEVGLRAGFSDQSHFTRLFRKLTGTTPHSYRMMKRS